MEIWAVDGLPSQVTLLLRCHLIWILASIMACGGNVCNS